MRANREEGEIGERYRAIDKEIDKRARREQQVKSVSRKRVRRRERKKSACEEKNKTSGERKK